MCNNFHTVITILNLPKRIILITVPFSKHVCFDVDSTLSSRVLGDGLILVTLRFNSTLVSFFEMDISFGRDVPRTSVTSVHDSFCT